MKINEDVTKMKAICAELEIPYWCSFSDFSSLNLRLSYPFPPVTTLFGLIQNALGQTAIHMFNDTKLENKYKKEYVSLFNKLDFSIIILDSGEIIEDYTNIHKGNRKLEKYEEELKKLIENENVSNSSSKFSKFNFYNFLSKKKFNESKIKEYEELSVTCSKYPSLEKLINNFWIEHTVKNEGYEGLKNWINTQIKRQKIINPLYKIYIKSEDEKYINKIYEALKNPVRPLYLGESDDLVNIINLKIVDIISSNSSNIKSIIPDMYDNSELVNIPVNLKFNKDINSDNHKICSIPKGRINKEIECYSYQGENFVFFENNCKI